MLEIENASTLERYIYAANDGGRWKFGAKGTPMEFENTEQYEAKKVQDRFTPEMLGKYLNHFGIDFFRLNFMK